MAEIRANGVWKQFLLRSDRADSVGQLLARMLPGRSRPSTRPFWALRDVSFEMPPSTSLGIIGRNGSGKSTLLKLLNRTMKPTRGSIQVRGRVSALIELGAGFHPDFTGRENVVLNGSILGLRRREVERRMEAIIDFAEIRDFIDTPVKYYSSGMQARLGFSVAIHVEPEILIVDEVLAVGDEAFQQKCMQRIYEMRRQGISILLVSHDLSSIERLMDRALWIDGGEVCAAGAPHTVIRAYRQQVEGEAEVHGDPSAEAPSGPQGQAAGAPGEALRLIDAYVAVNGSRRDTLKSGDAPEIVCECDNPQSCAVEVYPLVTLRRPDGLVVAELSALREGVRLTLDPGKRRVGLAISELHLAGGQYEMDAALLLPDGTRTTGSSPAARFRVAGSDGGLGVVTAPHVWTVH